MEFVYILFLVLFGMEFIQTPHCNGKTYYVKPTQDHTPCPGQPCETLQHYIDIFDNQSNVIVGYDITVIFLEGTHTVYRINSSRDIIMNRSSITMKGQEDGNCTIQCSMPDEFYKNSILVLVMYYATFHVHHLNFQELIAICIIETKAALGSNIVRWSSVFVNHTSFTVGIHRATFKQLATQRSIVHINPVAEPRELMLIECTFLARSHVYIESSTSLNLTQCKFNGSELVAISSDVKLYGINTFYGAFNSAVKCYKSNFTVTGKVLFVNNTGTRGAGLALYSSKLKIGAGANLTFINGTALDRGGAIYTEPGLSPFAYMLNTIVQKPSCFYELLDCHNQGHYYVHFSNNSVNFDGPGDDLYGASFSSSLCSEEEHFGCSVTVTGASSKISSISSDPTRVCFCDNSGLPKCNETYRIGKVSPGEVFPVNLTLVGENLGGTTTGLVVIYSLVHFLGEPTPIIKPGRKTIIDTKQCKQVNYSLYTNDTHIPSVMYFTSVYSYPNFVNSFNPDYSPIVAKVVLNMTIVPCPPGFLLVGNPPRCDCNYAPCDVKVHCTIIGGNGLFSWNGSLWVGINNQNNTICNRFCPVDYCNVTEAGEQIDIFHNMDSQCAYSRAGRLCGGCRENYSLAIGSNRCIRCPNNNNVALLIFFALAGIVLVLFILAINLTVPHSAINGLIFYANIIWIYQNIFFPKGHDSPTVMLYLKAFIAWVNLDFGIETCFVNGLTAFWKVWLQFVFPVYIWCIVGVIIMAARHSVRFSRLLPRKRTIPVLATVFLLSYTKFVSITSSALKFSLISEYPMKNGTLVFPKPLVSVVWSLDGNLPYCGYPHIFLFLAGIATLLGLWLPYTLLLLLAQWLRRISHLRPLQWTQHFSPIFDAYFAPLKHKHQYWFGVLLLVRGILLVTSTSAFGIPYAINLLVLLVFVLVLLFYMNLMQVYKSTESLLLNSSFNLNLIVLSAYFILAYTQSDWQRLQMVAIGVSTGFAFLQFCGIVIFAIAKQCWSHCKRHCVKTPDDDDIDEPLLVVN